MKKCIFTLLIIISIFGCNSIEENKHKENLEQDSVGIKNISTKPLILHKIFLDDDSVKIVNGDTKNIKLNDFEVYLSSIFVDKYINKKDTSSLIALKLYYPDEQPRSTILAVKQAITNSYNDLWTKIAMVQYSKSYEELDKNEKKTVVSVAPYLVSGKTPSIFNDN